MRIVPTGKVEKQTDRQKELNELTLKLMRILAIVVAFASAFVFFIKILYL